MKDLDCYKGLRHGPATYFHPSGSKEEATYDEGYESGPSVVLFASGKGSVTYDVGTNL